MSTAPQTGDATSGSAQISDRTYRNYDGPLKTRAIRWWVVSLATLRTNLRKPWFWVLTALVVLAYLANGVILYFTKNVTDNAAAFGGGAASLDLEGTNSFYATTLFTCIQWTNFFIFLLALVVGTGSIAADNAANALLVYLSKPLNRVDYLVGKWMGVFLLLAGVSLIPALLMYCFYIASYYEVGFLKGNPELFWRMCLACLVGPAIHTSLVIGFSSITKSARIAGAVFAATFFLLSTLTTISSFALWNNARNEVDAATDIDIALKKVDKNRLSTVGYVSPNGVVNGLAQHLYDVENQNAVPRRFREFIQRPNLTFLLILGGVFLVVPVALAASRIRAVEVING